MFDILWRASYNTNNKDINSSAFINGYNINIIQMIDNSDLLLY